MNRSDFSTDVFFNEMAKKRGLLPSAIFYDAPVKSVNSVQSVKDLSHLIPFGKREREASSVTCDNI